ncbi:vesicle-associated membrane protein 721 [Phtheirospermum japonicum]|uniref:Vesicle-associated membrane protein 721 n=1 Tax=Phtheirospermum japonicum TaxID=374723 RepID=A0A830D385_9LAMI|nr:vesicle-associated membrane protein 721 [Phtheirospermum japonicum]
MDRSFSGTRSFVARGTVTLAEYTEFTGNFTGIAAQYLHKLPATNKFTYNYGGHTFNHLVNDGSSKCLLFTICSLL